MKRGLVRCYRCDFIYDGEKNARCPKCGRRMSDMKFADRWRYLWRNFWRWFDGSHQEPKPKTRKKRSSGKHSS